MAELQKKVETDSAPVAEPVPVPVTTEPPLAEAPVAPVAAPKAVEKKVVAAPVPPPPPPPEPAAEETKALATVGKTPEPAKRQISGGSLDRDIALAEVEKEKRLSYVKAWEESEKSKAENKAQKQLSAVDALENSKKAAIEAKLKKIEEQLERKKAEYAEKMRNKIALVHKEAEEKRAMVEAKRGEEMLKAEEMAAKFRATGTTPKKAFGCF